MHRGGLLLVCRQRLQISDMEEKVMLMTMKELMKVRRCLREASEALTEIEKMLNNEMTILGVPEIREDDFELEGGQVEYDLEQCARNK